MCMLHIPAAFCLGDRDFCCCEKCVDKCPKYNFVGTTMSRSRPLCEKPECPQPGKKRKATVAHTGKENEQEGGPEPPKKLCLSLKKGKQKATSVERFNNVTDDAELAEISKGYVPPNTEKNTGWAMRVYRQWRQSREDRGNNVPDIFQQPYNCEVLSHWLAVFVTEARKSDGTKYPAKSLYQILCGILHFMRKRDPCAPNFLDQKDGRFRELIGTCESVFRILRQSGIGANPQKAAAISKEEENILWETGILSCSMPKSLQRAVFFYMGKDFCLRGGEEQRQLKPSQLVHKRDPDHYVYIETGSKNRSGGLRQINVENKIVPIYASPAAGERCLVFLLDLYLSKLL